MASAPFIFLLSVGTMAAGLLLLGAYLLVVQNMRDVLDHFGRDLRVVAFLDVEAGADDARRSELSQRFAALEGVGEVIWVAPERALERLRQDLGREASILEGLESNPLPGSFEIELHAANRSPQRVRELAKEVAALEGIEDVRYGEDWVEGYASLLRAVVWLGVGFGGFLMLILGTIVAGTVRLGLYARSDEIQIQRLVGAGGLFVRLPFYLEGALQGGLAALLALSVLWGLYQLGLPLLGDLLAFLLGRDKPDFFGITEAILLLVLGIGLGLGAAMLSLLRLEETA